MSAAWSLTVGGVSGPGVEPSCLYAVSKTGAEIGGNTVDASVVVVNNVAGASARLMPATGAMLGGEMLEGMELLNSNQRTVLLLTLYCYQSLNPC